MIKDIIMAFTFMSALIFGYLFFMWWLNWFNKKYEIKERKNEK